MTSNHLAEKRDTDAHSQIWRIVRRAAGLAVFWGTVAVSGLAWAQGVGELGEGLTPSASPSQKARFDVGAYLRLRGATFYNLDLDRGVTPSGTPLFPVPVANPQGQTVSYSDLRVRTDLSAASATGTLAAHVRIDVLDNLVLGSTPIGSPSSSRALTPAASPGQQSPANALRIKRAYGQVLLPFGLLAAGRMGNSWGMGMVSASGDCDDCDYGDSADRIIFVTPLFGHVWGAMYDFASSGSLTPARDGERLIDFDPTDNVRTATFVVMNYHTDLARERRRSADRTTVEYGLLASHRWQTNDAPSQYTLSEPRDIGAGDFIARGYRATVGDLWLRVTTPRAELEAEAAVVTATVEQPTLVPGALYHVRAESLQTGAAVRSRYALVTDHFWLGLDAGYASGDPAPGFGAFPQPGAPRPVAGDIDGAQADLPVDNRIDNFRFHPDFRIDRILFREIIGTVTDAMYVRPHLTWRIAETSSGRLDASVAAIASRAVEPTSTPGGQTPLGVEVDPTLRYVGADGFTASLEHAVLVPLSGLDNLETRQKAKPAQLIRLRLGYRF